MNIRGVIKNMSVDFRNGRCILSVEMTEGVPADVEALRDKDLAIELKPWRSRRSTTANGLLWHCIGVIANAQLGEQKLEPFEIYKSLLRKYGQFTMIRVKANAVEAFRRSYREVDEVGRWCDADGTEWVDLLCYFGSSQYDAHEFGMLLDGVIDDMKQAGLETPPSEEMRRVLAQLEKQEAKHEKE